MILLDTNALIYSVKNKIPIEKYLDDIIAIPSSVILELEGLATENGQAKVALKLAKKFKVVEVQSRGDQGVEEAALKMKAKVVTADIALKKRLSKNGIQTISIGESGVRG